MFNNAPPKPVECEERLMLQLVSATPSPFARKVRIALLEKAIPFELITDVPWNENTVVGNFNPLEKLPILITEGDGCIYDSSLIIDYLEMTCPEPALLPRDPKLRFAAKAVEVLQNGICDAVVLTFFERARPKQAQSAQWLARQRRKIERGTAALAAELGGKEHFVGGAFTLADIAAGCALGYLDLRLPDFDWRPLHPGLARWFDGISGRESFRQTVPAANVINATMN
jgi:glutathione S-transferase